MVMVPMPKGQFLYVPTGGGDVPMPVAVGIMAVAVLACAAMIGVIAYDIWSNR